MKKIYLILLLFISIKSTAENSDTLLKISGKISGKYGIEMSLRISKNSVYGYYYYTKYKTYIPLIGKFNSEKSEINLIENPWTENSLNHPTQGFILNISNNVIVGKWFDKTPKKELSVTGYFKSEKSTTPKIQGDYVSIHNSDKYSANIELLNIHNKLFFFMISTATYSGCVGEMTGIIEIENNKGVFSKENCKEILLKFEKDNLIVEENECNFHGYRCSFNGKYSKQ